MVILTFLYSNDHAPTADFRSGSGATYESTPSGGVLRLDEQQSAALSFLLKDEDGDPMRVVATGPSTSGTARGLREATVSAVEVDDAVSEDGERIVNVTLQAGTVCQKNESAGFVQMRASDGLEAHTLEKNVELLLKHTRTPEVPPVELVGVGEVSPGLLPRELQPGGGTALTLKPMLYTTTKGCQLSKMSWTPLDPGAPVPDQPTKGTAVFAPPALFCKPEGQDFRYRFDVEDEGELTNSAEFTVHLKSNRDPLEKEPLELWVDAAGQVQVDSKLNCRGEHNGGFHLFCFGPEGFTLATGRWLRLRSVGRRNAGLHGIPYWRVFHNFSHVEDGEH